VKAMSKQTNPGGFNPIKVNPEKVNPVEFRQEKVEPLKLDENKHEETPAPGSSKVRPPPPTRLPPKRFLIFRFRPCRELPLRLTLRLPPNHPSQDVLRLLRRSGNRRWS